MLKKVPILGIQWSTLTEQQLRAQAVVIIDKPFPKDSCDIEKRINTPNDPRMGEQKEFAQCGTCFKTNLECPGHLGIIDIPFPIYNKDYVDFVIKILQCVCYSCSRLRMTAENVKLLGIGSQQSFDYLKALAGKCKNIRVCPWDECGEPLVFYSKGKKKPGENAVIYYTADLIKKSQKAELKADVAYSILSKISFDDTVLMGFNRHLLTHPFYTDPQYFSTTNDVHVHQFRPESLIWHGCLPVIPPTARPYIKVGDEIKEDDISNKYNILIETIRKYNLLYSEPEEDDVKPKAKKSAKLKTKSEFEQEINNIVWEITSNKKDENPNKKGPKIRSFVLRIIYKDGRVQQNVGGKRTNYSARSVIVDGGTALEDDELGVPEEIAQVETKEFPVGSWNINDMQELVRQGKVTHVKRRVLNLDKRVGKLLATTRLSTIPDGGRNFILREGDIIERQLINGDWVFFNRQPTLQPGGMVSFRTKIVEGDAFRLPLMFTRAYNADFDGEQ